MTGTVLNAAAVLGGGLLAVAGRRLPAASTQGALKVLLGVFTVWTGLSTVWRSVEGPFLHALGQLGIAVLALVLGHATGRLLHLQDSLNHLGRFAKQRLESAQSGPRPTFADGFLTCSVLFCTNPLAVLGSLLDGLGGHWQVLAIKAVMDGLSMLAFVGLFGAPALLAVFPLVAFQGTLTLGAAALAQGVLPPPLAESVGAVGGLVVFSVSLIILDLKKVQLADYLPSLAFAPLLTALFR